jgi:hypothetical protein
MRWTPCKSGISRRFLSPKKKTNLGWLGVSRIEPASRWAVGLPLVPFLPKRFQFEIKGTRLFSGRAGEKCERFGNSTGAFENSPRHGLIGSVASFRTEQEFAQ